jgi:glycosyltransferase involved in cell wall biosynthesis
VDDGVSGVLVPARDAPALAKALLGLLHDPLRRQAMGRAAQDRFERYFSLQRFIEAHERLYEEMLAEHPRYSQIAV